MKGLKLTYLLLLHQEILTFLSSFIDVIGSFQCINVIAKEHY